MRCSYDIKWVEACAEGISKFEAQRGKSKVVKGSLDPWWNEAFRLPLDKASAAPTLEIVVEDWDLLSGNDFMGRVELPLRPGEEAKLGAAGAGAEQEEQEESVEFGWARK